VVSIQESIKTVVIEDGITHIGAHAFALWTELTSVTIGNSVKSIGEVAFGKSHNLVSVIFGNLVEYSFYRFYVWFNIL
jgi:hypothetical protein